MERNRIGFVVDTFVVPEIRSKEDDLLAVLKIYELWSLS